MCLQDVRIGRNSNSTSRTVAAAGGQGGSGFSARPDRITVTAALALGDGLLDGENVIVGIQTEGGLYPLFALTRQVQSGWASIATHGQPVTGAIVVFTGDGVTPNVILGETYLVIPVEQAVQ